MSQYLPTRVFPNDFPNVTSRRFSDIDVVNRSPNPSALPKNNDSQINFYKSFSTRKKSKDISFTYDPVPKNANIATGKDTVGIQTNVRV